MMEQGDCPADEVDLGEEVTNQFQVVKPVGTVVSTRLEPELAQSLLQRSGVEGKRISQLLREAIATYLATPAPPKVASGFAQVTVGGTAPVTGVFSAEMGTITEGVAHELELGWWPR
ncbi:MAG: hypothetical protein ACR2JC_14130 [Chloroflexota bacterium]|nr:MAG: hypothetical protein DLM70_18650 [Chloroflexota bacterium]